MPDQTLSSDPQILASSQQRSHLARISKVLTTVNQLHFDRLGLFGRLEEINLVKECLARLVRAICNKENSDDDRQRLNSGKTKGTELILIGGASGTGKSSLGLELKRHVKAANGLFCFGKYNLNQREQPFVGIAAACNELCLKIAKWKTSAPDLFRNIQHALLQRLGAEQIRLLQILVTSICHVVTLQNESKTCDKQEKDDGNVISSIESKQNQLSAAFCKFFAAVASFLEAPLVLLLDDLQWADEESLETMKKLLVSETTWGLMVIGCFRSDEVANHDHIFFKTRQDLMRRKEDPGCFFCLTEINLGNLSVANLAEMISELLSKESHEVHQLAKICHQRTGGNVFFVKAFLSMLVEEGFLSFHLATFQWQWSIKAIEQQTCVTPNIVHVIRARITKMHRSAIELLKLGACLGNTFDRHTLWIVWRERASTPSGSEEEFSELLHQSIENFCLIPLGATKERASIAQTQLSGQRSSTIVLRFNHDKIQEAVISLLSPEEFRVLQHQVGNALLDNLLAEELDCLIFRVANLVNCGQDLDTRAARVNLQAAMKAKKLAASSCATFFVKQGISKLPTTCLWEVHFDLALQLYSLGAVAEQMSGNNTEALRYCRVIVQQEKATALQKCQAYKVQLDILHNQSEYSKVVKNCLCYLSELGYKFPKLKVVRKALANAYLRKTMRMEWITTIDSIERIPMMTDATTVEVVQLLEILGSDAYVAGDMDLYSIARCHFIRLVGKHGLTNDAASAFASFSNLLMHKHGYFEAAEKIAKLSLQIQDLLPSEFYKARTVMTAQFNVLGWITPVQNTMKHLLEGYASGMKLGNIGPAMFCIIGYLYSGIVCGTKLSLLLDDCRGYSHQMEQFKFEIGLDVLGIMWQMMENLQAISTDCSNTVVLTGKVMDETGAMATGKNHFAKLVPRFKGYACMYFGDYATGADIFIKIGGIDFIKTNLYGMGYGSDYFPFGLCCFVMAKQTNQKHYKKLACQTRNEMFSLVQKKCLNLVHMLRVLDAEYQAMIGKHTLAKEYYERAVIEAVRGGFIQNAAVASLRFSELLLECEELAEARYRFHESIKYFKEWGAHNVVRLVLAKKNKAF